MKKPPAMPGNMGSIPGLGRSPGGGGGNPLCYSCWIRCDWSDWATVIPSRYVSSLSVGPKRRPLGWKFAEVQQWTAGSQDPSPAEILSLCPWVPRQVDRYETATLLADAQPGGEEIFVWVPWFSDSWTQWIFPCNTQFSSVAQLCELFATPQTAARQASLSITTSRSSPKLMFIESVMPFNHLILCHPLLLPSIFPSIRVFSNESALHIKWPKYWSFSFISPSSEHPELISFRMDWLHLLAVQGTLKSLLQYHSSKASILRHSAFLLVQLTCNIRCSITCNFGMKYAFSLGFYHSGV